MISKIYQSDGDNSRDHQAIIGWRSLDQGFDPGLNLYL